MLGSTCNSTFGIGLLDYAYLALNVYHSYSDDRLLGFRPQKAQSPVDLKSQMSQNNGWFYLSFPQLNIQGGLLHQLDFYAEFYAKVYKGKIQHLMISFRGTCKKYDYIEDGINWWSTVMPGDDGGVDTSLPAYWVYAYLFVMNCNQVIKALDDEHLLAERCGMHITGHSLGGALANLVAATNMICQPAHIKSQMPVSPDVVSFNAPGIGDFDGINLSHYDQDRVISMRAQYDMVSALGDGYGHIINNIIPEGLKDASQAFAIEHHIEREGMLGRAGELVEDLVLKTGQIETETMTPRRYDASYFKQNPGRIQQLGDSKSIYEQHSMDNMFKVIAQHPETLMMNYHDLLIWSNKHGGYNHDLKAAPLFGQAAMAQAA